MKQSPFFLLCLVALSLAACSTSSPPPSTTSNMDNGAVTDTTATTAPVTTDATTSAAPTTTTSSTPTPNAQAQPKPWTPPADSTASNATAAKYPTAIAIPGKKGFVKSPYAQYAAPVDVRGFSSGTIVRCPYTNKKFIVP